MRMIYKAGKVEIWETGAGFFVYGVTLGGDPIVCPSLGMAHEVAGGAV